MNTLEVIWQNIRNRLPLAVGAGIVLLAMVAFAVTRSNDSGAAGGPDPTFRVRQGPLTISVIESGTIKSLDQASLKCEVEGQTTLIFLIPEGTRVKKDDLLVELDASKLEDNIIQQQISVQNAEAAFIRARENLAVAKNQAESDISRAGLDYEFAQEDVTQHLEGQHPQDLLEAQSNITLAREELERATEKLAWSERLFEEKYISQTELDADRLTHNRAKLNHELAVAELALLSDYTSKRKLAELKSDVDQAKMALERVKLQANADIVQAEADLKARETDFTRQKSKLTKYEEQLSKTKIYAPRDGLVVYATSVQGGGRHRRREPLEEGQGVRERQELIYLPSADSMMAQIPIHESSLEKVQLGQLTRVKVDAIPDKVFTGRVAKIAPLPDAQSAWLNPDLKVYPTEIHLEGTHPDLRTGMSCSAEIIVEQHAAAIYVPTFAVLRIGNQPTVWMRKRGRLEPREIEIGLDNNSMVHVLAGLEPGEKVVLTPPLEAQAEADASQEDVAQAQPAVPATGAAPVKPPGAERPAHGERGRPAGEAKRERPEKGGDENDWQKMRQRFQNMTPEERQEAMRKRMESMTDEEREEWQRRREERRSRGDGQHGEGQRGGGGHGGEGHGGGGE